MSREPCPAFWTDGGVTIVLANVSMTFWAEEDGYRPMPFECACAPGDLVRYLCVQFGSYQIRLNARGLHDREKCIDFLHALSLYWETRV